MSRRCGPPWPQHSRGALAPTTASWPIARTAPACAWPRRSGYAPRGGSVDAWDDRRRMVGPNATVHARGSEGTTPRADGGSPLRCCPTTAPVLKHQTEPASRTTLFRTAPRIGSARPVRPVFLRQRPTTTSAKQWPYGSFAPDLDLPWAARPLPTVAVPNLNPDAAKRSRWRWPGGPAGNTSTRFLLRRVLSKDI